MAPERWTALDVVARHDLVVARTRDGVDSGCVVLPDAPRPRGVEQASIIVELAIGLIVFVGVMVWQVHQYAVSDNPALRALEGLFGAAPVPGSVRDDLLPVESGRCRDGAELRPVEDRLALLHDDGLFDRRVRGRGCQVRRCPGPCHRGQMALDLIIVGVGVAHPSQLRATGTRRPSRWPGPRIRRQGYVDCHRRLSWPQPASAGRVTGATCQVFS